MNRVMLGAVLCFGVGASGIVAAAENFLHAAVLPSQAPHFNFADRAAPPRVFFATLLNDSDKLLQNCRVELAAELPFILDYQVTERVQNRSVGPANTPAIISPRDYQTFRFTLRMNRDDYVAQQKAGFRFVCDDVAPAAIVEDINTVLISAGAAPGPDLLSAVAVASDDGVLQLDATPGGNSSNGAGVPCQLVSYPGGPVVPCAVGAYAFALVNTQDTARALEIVETSGMHFTQLCRTDSSGVCTDSATPQSSLQVTLNGGELATFSAYLVALDDFAFNPFDDFLSAGIDVFEQGTLGAGRLLKGERVRARAPAFEWSAKVVVDDGVDVLRVNGSLWVPSGCHRAELVPVFGAQTPAEELHLELSARADTVPPSVSCVQAVTKTAALYESDSAIDGVTTVVVRNGPAGSEKRLSLPVKR